ncbi:Gfo/Idh/MocA family protein [Cohnella sp. JJ-181]|uniref:Gfo/Idh/MocA family protein n=1 Tax=Cohnella rhizoplanae TaxID=2974897 RepID=UPI0022FFC021|nr:Gfo/Idh/MocA family oxidoreductase [Cohnella sp. JJ-181]CAI6087721.1 dTDP-3,4-didehydro-2,6-dideoxy-alpha-D-glucose 3-reductase [Cohnella sp. JJ-181]
MERKLRWGILGCAGIAVRAVIPGLQQSERGVVAAIASRDLDKAKQTAEQLGIDAAYGSYEALLADDTIDAVYIPLPNHLHLPWTIRAAEAGKHVLCEKPIALDAAEAGRMIEACRAGGVHLAEAFMYRHHPRYRMIRELIASGEIGEIRGIHGAFTFNNAANHANIRYRREWGGGSVYDVGCYPISAARLILGREPEAATAHAFFSPEHDGVDMMASGLVEFSDGVSLTFDCGMWASSRNTLEVLGTKGAIQVPSAFVAGPDGSADFVVVSGGERREVEVPRLNQYALQGDDFARAALDGAAMPFEPEDAARNMKVIDAVLRSARERARIAIS